MFVVEGGSGVHNLLYAHDRSASCDRPRVLCTDRMASTFRIWPNGKLDGETMEG